jgi:DNA repair photolyase
MLHSAGYAIQVLTKGGRRALRDMDLFTAQDAFATTLTLLSDEHSRKWEPRAALPQERIETLQRFHEAGIPTWVSLEPVLNPVSALEIIRRTYEFVDMFKVGKLNNHPLASRIDWATFAQEAVQLLKETHSQFYIKLDLAAYLDESAKSDIRHYLHGPDNSTATRH